MASPVVTAVLGAALSWTPRLHAEPVAATGKGIVGGALLGGEAALITEAILRVKPRWAYLLGGALGSVLGGVGGYFVEQSGDARLSMILLTGGTALVIPASIITLDATVYREPSDPLMDRAPGDAAMKPRNQRARRSTAARASSPRRQPSVSGSERNVGVLSVTRDSGSQHFATTWSVPRLSLAPVYSQDELNFGLRQRASVRMPLLSMVF